MIAKIQDDNFRDKHIIEAARFRYNQDQDILECFTSLCSIEPTTIGLCHGDRIFFMNDSGKTVDAKRVVKVEAKEIELTEARQIEVIKEFAARIEKAAIARGSIDDVVKQKMSKLASILTRCVEQGKDEEE